MPKTFRIGDVRVTKVDTYFQGKQALVTGAASGIGLELSEKFASLGAKVLLTDRDEARLKEAVDRLREGGADVEGYVLDVTDVASFEKLVQQLDAESREVDILVNNAGKGMVGCVCDHSLNDWEMLLDLNVKGVIYGIHTFYPRMIKRGRGSIINIASMAGLIPVPGGTPYAMSKHAIVGLSQSLRAEAKALGINVSAICPSFVKTNIFEAAPIVNLPRSFGEGMVKASGGFISLEDFVEEAIIGIAEEKSLVVLPRKARIMWHLSKFFPDFLARKQQRVGQKLFQSRLDSSLERPPVAQQA
jgi:short-subunit dehydrogenase